MDNKLAEEIKLKKTSEAEFISLCNKDIQYHVDRSFNYYMMKNYELANEELEKVKDLTDKAIAKLSLISQL